jgi:hypothetical protein
MGRRPARRLSGAQCRRRAWVSVRLAFGGSAARRGQPRSRSLSWASPCSPPGARGLAIALARVGTRGPRAASPRHRGPRWPRRPVSRPVVTGLTPGGLRGRGGGRRSSSMCPRGRAPRPRGQHGGGRRPPRLRGGHARPGAARRAWGAQPPVNSTDRPTHPASTLGARAGARRGAAGRRARVGGRRRGVCGGTRAAPCRRAGDGGSPPAAAGPRVWARGRGPGGGRRGCRAAAAPRRLVGELVRVPRARPPGARLPGGRAPAALRAPGPVAFWRRAPCTMSAARAAAPHTRVRHHQPDTVNTH